MGSHARRTEDASRPGSRRARSATRTTMAGCSSRTPAVPSRAVRPEKAAATTRPPSATPRFPRRYASAQARAIPRAAIHAPISARDIVPLYERPAGASVSSARPSIPAARRRPTDTIAGSGTRMADDPSWRSWSEVQQLRNALVFVAACNGLRERTAMASWLVRFGLGRRFTSGGPTESTLSFRGLKLCLDWASSEHVPLREVLIHGEYWPEEGFLPSVGQTVVDVGANAGVYS